MKKIYCEYCSKPLSENCGCRTELEKKVDSLEQKVIDMKMKILQHEYDECRKRLSEIEARQKIEEMFDESRKVVRKYLEPKTESPLPPYSKRR